jgi:phosphoribosyl 1,2-cyclic phosphodiesterase
VRVKVLGSAAGGGFPQWNCGCPNGNAAATDPVCSLAPAHALIEAARSEASDPGARTFEYRMRKARVRP